MHRAVAVLLALCVAIVEPASAALAPLASVALAQDSGDAPALGPVVLQDTLTGTGPFRPNACPTGKNRSEFVEDGFRTRVTGRCTDTSTSAVLGSTAVGLTFANGDIAVDAKVAEGHDRAWIAMYLREQNNGDTYFVAWLPAQGRAELRKAIGSISVQLAENGDIGPIDPDVWTRLAVRFAGPKMWVLLNDQPILSATDQSLSRGGFAIGAGRIGNVEDDAAVGVVWRNLQVTALANEPQSVPRTPRPAAAAPSSSGSAASAPAASAPPTGTPPAVGQVVYQEPLTERGIIPTGSCPTGKGRGEVVGEGFLMAVSGRCTAQARNASVGPTLAGLTLPDGEVRLEFKITQGVERASITIATRYGRGPGNSYAFGVAPSLGGALILKISAGGQGERLGQRFDLGGQMSRDDWSSVAVRVLGSSLWLLVNDQPVLSAEDATFDGGFVGLGVGRSGSVDDDDEVAVVFRNLTVSKIEGAPDDRAPTYVRPSGPPSGPGSVLSLAR